MHQPLTPTGGDDLRTAALIGNLQTMAEHPGVGDNHNAPAFRRCYARMGEFIPALLAEGLRAAGHARVLRHAAARAARSWARTT